jgi:CII-binding regulator of phage lambda lysogenization HflD
VFLYLFILSLTGCSDFKQEEQLKSVEELQAKSNTLQSKFKEAFPDTLSSMRQNMMHMEVFLKNHVILDSVDRSYGSDMDAYKETRNKIGAINKQYLVLKKAFSKETKQLEQLHKDVVNGFGKRQQYDSYILTEKKNVKKLEEHTLAFVKAITEIKDKYQLLHPRLNALAFKFRGGE